MKGRGEQKVAIVGALRENERGRGNQGEKYEGKWVKVGEVEKEKKIEPTFSSSDPREVKCEKEKSYGMFPSPTLSNFFGCKVS